MSQHTVSIPNGKVTFSSVDLEFLFEGKETYMEMHRYCGPSFYTLDEDEMEVWLEPDDSPRWDSLWEEFQKWDDARKR